MPLGISLIKAGCDVNKSFLNNGLGFSPFYYLFKLQKSKFTFYQRNNMSASNDAGFQEENNDDYLLQTIVKNLPVKLYTRLIELIILAGYKLTNNDFKLFDESWLSTFLDSNYPKMKTYLVGLFLENGLYAPRSLTSLCRIKVRELLRKPIRPSIIRLDIPSELKHFLYLENLKSHIILNKNHNIFE